MIARYLGLVASLAGAIALGVAFAGCPSSQAITRATDTSETSLDTTVYREGFPWGIRPGSCRVVATLLRVDGDKSAQSANDPCGAHPCRGWSIVDTVLGCGEGVSDPLRVGDTVLFYFPMTLDDTRDISAVGGRTVYPGLIPSDRFGADVVYLITPTSYTPRVDGSLTVYNYSRRTVRTGGGS